MQHSFKYSKNISESCVHKHKYELWLTISDKTMNFVIEVAVVKSCAKKQIKYRNRAFLENRTEI